MSEVLGDGQFYARSIQHDTRLLGAVWAEDL